MGLIRCDKCGNLGSFEILEAEYSEIRAVEKMQCCRCGAVITNEMW